MYSKAVLVAAMLAVVEARFGEEGKVQNVIQGLGQFGNPGQAATLAGQTPGVLLAGANACAKVCFHVRHLKMTKHSHPTACPRRHHRLQPG